MVQDLLHLENRHIEDLNDIGEYVNMANIDFAKVNAILEQERNKTVELLKDAVG